MVSSISVAVVSSTVVAAVDMTGEGEGRVGIFFETKKLRKKERRMKKFI